MKCAMNYGTRILFKHPVTGKIECGVVGKFYDVHYSDVSGKSFFVNAREIVEYCEAEKAFDMFQYSNRPIMEPDDSYYKIFPKDRPKPPSNVI